MKTFRFRLKNKNINALNRMADVVNFCWNFANATSAEYFIKHNKWLSGYDLDRLSAGCSKELGINSQTIQLVNHEHAIRRKQVQKTKLKWRSRKRSLGWVPMKANCMRVKGDEVIYNGHTFRFWKAQEISGTIKSGSFVQDSRGRWYVCINCQTQPETRNSTGNQVGIDLGLKTIATLSNGVTLSRDNITIKYAKKLATAQRARKAKRVQAIHLRIKNTRRDWNHKQTTILTALYDFIVVGDVSPSKLKKTKMAKSVSDAGWANFKSMLKYKAIALGVEYKEVKEHFSTVTCSACLQRTGPSGLGALGVREWTCSCGAFHNRDVNAAKNILRFGHESPKGAERSEMPSLTRELIYDRNSRKE